MPDNILITQKGVQTVRALRVNQKQARKDFSAGRVQVLSNIRAGSVVGMDGGGFPAIQKIEAACASASPEKYLVVNGVASDPVLLHDEWLLKNKWQDILMGIRVLQRCQSFQKVFVVSRSPHYGVCQKKCPIHLPIGGMVKAAKYGLTIPKDVSELCLGCNACTCFCSAGINTACYIK